VRTRAGDHVSVSDFCRVAAVSERALQNAFREVMGLTPRAYKNCFGELPSDTLRRPPEAR